MTTNEPSAEEIVRNFRGAHIFGITQALENRIADRLESQEQKIAALTARAEKAENERNLAVKALADYEDAIDPTVEQIMREFHGTEWRGLPQDGEGK